MGMREDHCKKRKVGYENINLLPFLTSSLQQ